MRQGNEIPVLGKTIQILEYIGSHPGHVSQPELQAALKIPQATCYRIITTLVANNWLQKFNHNHYDISTGLLPVVNKVMFQLETYRTLQPTLERLSKNVGYSSKLSVRDGTEQVNVLCAKAPWDIALTTVVGTRDQIITGGSVGTIFMSTMNDQELKAYLQAADSPEAAEQAMDHIDFFRKNGYVFNPASTSTAPNVKWHVDALSVPVQSTKGTILAVLTILSTPGELAGANHGTLVKTMMQTAMFCAETLE